MTEGLEKGVKSFQMWNHITEPIVFPSTEGQILHVKTKMGNYVVDEGP